MLIIKVSHLKNNRCNEPLNLGCLGPGLLAFLCRQGSLDDILTHIIQLAQIEQLPDLGGSLGTQAARNRYISQARDLLKQENTLPSIL